MLGGFVSEQLIHPEELHKNAVEIEGGQATNISATKKPSGPDPILHLIATADVTKGAKLSKACTACHSSDKDGANKVGPNLWDIVGGPKAGKAGFKYSKAMSDIGGAWDYNDLNKFLWKPKSYAPGTKMGYAGMKKAQDRADIIAWLRTLSESELALPSEADIAKEKAELAPPAAPQEETPEVQAH